MSGRRPAALAVALLGLALLIGVAAALGAPRAALACSGVPDPAAADVIIAGYATDLALVPLDEVNHFVGARVTFVVDRYLRGSGEETLVARAPNSVTRDPSAGNDVNALIEAKKIQFVGAAGACGGLTQDPRGYYWVVGFTRGDDGRLVMNLLLNFAIGESPEDPSVEDAIDRVEAALAARGEAPPPATSGQAGTVRQPGSITPGQSVGLVLGVVAVVLLGRYASREGGWG
jgi:hypothetical protein